MSTIAGAASSGAPNGDGCWIVVACGGAGTYGGCGDGALPGGAHGDGLGGCADAIGPLPGGAHGDALGGAALGDAALGDAALGDAALGDAALGDAALGGAALGDAAIGAAVLGDAALGAAALGSRACACGPGAHGDGALAGAAGGCTIAAGSLAGCAACCRVGGAHGDGCGSGHTGGGGGDGGGDGCGGRAANGDGCCKPGGAYGDDGFGDGDDGGDGCCKPGGAYGDDWFGDGDGDGCCKPGGAYGFGDGDDGDGGCKPGGAYGDGACGCGGCGRGAYGDGCWTPLGDGGCCCGRGAYGFGALGPRCGCGACCGGCGAYGLGAGAPCGRGAYGDGSSGRGGACPPGKVPVPGGRSGFDIDDYYTTSAGLCWRPMSSGEQSEPSSSDPGGDIALAKTAAPGATPPNTIDDSEVIGDRPAGDEVGRKVARARIANRLFATEERVRLGRYHLLEMVGAGGMGVVWGAWDPELDRRVAIKLVKATMQAARDRILIEGQSLAKLSHPNVVPVYDVGVFEEQVYLVMEWVRGKNLRAYCKEPHAIREILAVYRDAAEGLAAAHRVGLIHRDFKPDNAMIGDDGRVRVLDFGLARGEVKPESTSDSGKSEKVSSDLTRGAGTPRYMPPEQAQGEALTPAVDQYAFCVSLREALLGRNADDKEAVLPRWLSEIVNRGTSHAAAERFASMDELVRALGRDPATIWRRRLVVGGALGLVGVAFAVGSVRGGGESVEVCGTDEIAASWNPGKRTALTAHLQTLGPYGIAESSRLAAALEAYSTSWAKASKEACLAKEGGTLTPQLYERNQGCLARSRVALDTIVDVATTVNVERFPDVIVAARALPSAERCLVDSKTSTVAPPPEAIATQVNAVANDVERARVRAWAADPEAMKLAKSAVDAAAPLKYAPLTARAQLVHGLAAWLQENDAVALAALDAATRAAFEAGDLPVGVEAYARKLYVKLLVSEPRDSAADLKRRDEGGIEVVESIANGLGAQYAFQRALLYNNIGSTFSVDGQQERAHAWFERARDESRGATTGRVEIASMIANLAIDSELAVERNRLFKSAIDEMTRELGADHPKTLAQQIAHASFETSPPKAFALLEPACRRFQELYPYLTATIEQCTYNLGLLADEQGNRDRVRTLMGQVRFDGIESKVARGYLLLLDGSSETVPAMLALAREHRSSQHFWPRFRSVDALILAARVQLEAGDEQHAVTSLREGIRILEGIVPLKKRIFYKRRVARVQSLLARALAKTDPISAKRAASGAIDWYRTAGDYTADIAELSLITDSR